MFKVIKQLFNLLTKSQVKRFYILQILVLVMAFMEIIGVASIIPFMTLVGDMSQLQQNTIIAKIYNLSGIASETQFLLLLGIGVLIVLFIAATISMFTTWSISMFATKVGAEISDRLYTYYLKQNWLFHSSVSSAQLTKKIAIEASRVTGGIIMPLMQLNARAVLAIFMSLSIFIYDPKVAVTGLVVFAFAYSILFKLVRIRLQQNGKVVSEVNEQRFRLMNEGFGGIRDVLLLGRGNYFIKRFNRTGNKLAYSQGTNSALTQVPRYFVELIAFGSMISLVLYLIASHDGDLGLILPILSVYALAGFKLLPAFQQIYASVAGIKGNIAAFESIQNDFIKSAQKQGEKITEEQNYLCPKKKISLENIIFTYPTLEEPTLNCLSISIQANSIVGIVGPSGAGKSTLIDILLGLLEPQQGKLKVDNKIINEQTVRSWQNTIGFVGQHIFLSEGTIAENVSFGLPVDQIDLVEIRKALKLAHLSEFVSTLKYGIHTKVGERGVQLSGGQRQRLGIARALYHKAEVLVFDEATSSLDGISEKMIMEAIQNFGGEKTIILIAHRLKTVKNCDQIFYLENGRVIDKGTYQELIKSNKNFKIMAAHA